MRVLLPWDKLFLYDLRLQTTTDTYNAISKDGVNLTRDDQHPLSAEARRHPAAAPDHRPGLHVAPAEPRDRQPDARDHRAIHRRGGLLDQAAGDSGRNPHAHRCRCSARAWCSGPKRRASTASIIGSRWTRCSFSTTRCARARAAAGGQRRDQPQDRAVLSGAGIRLPRRAREEGIRTQADRGEGIREFQQTVTQGISDSYLRWRGIEATLQLAQSPNTKIVIIGSGKDGLPVILGNAAAQPPQKAEGPNEGGETKGPPAGQPAPSDKLPGPGAATPPQTMPAAGWVPPSATVSQH